jgi:hypothetical protein
LNTTIAVDGGGLVTIEFLVGRLSSFEIGAGANAPLTIREATPERFIFGQATHNWFRAQVTRDGGATILQVRIRTGMNTIHFNPDGLQGVTVFRNRVETFLWSDSHRMQAVDGADVQEQE